MLQFPVHFYTIILQPFLHKYKCLCHYATRNVSLGGLGGDAPQLVNANEHMGATSITFPYQAVHGLARKNMAVQKAKIHNTQRCLMS